MDAETPSQWTFYSTEGKSTKYTVSIEVAKLSSLFKNMIENSNEETSVCMQPTDQPHELYDTYYTINTDEMLSYVYQYMKLWEDQPEKANYVKQEPVQTSEVEHILQDKDIEFIRKFIDDGKATTEKEIKERLSLLLCQVDELLGIECLSNKIYAYIGVLFWNKSAFDFAEALEDPDFKAAQLKAVEDWKKDNPSRFARYISNNTTDILYPPTALTDAEDSEPETDDNETETEDTDVEEDG
jgi:hypothetical protein